MTLYCTYQIVETPLNHELEPLIRIRKRDLPGYPVQDRMLMILCTVLITVVAFALLLRQADGVAGQSSEAQEGHESSAENSIAFAGSISNVFSDEIKHWEPAILTWSARHQLDPDVVATIMQIESCGDPLAISNAGAQGLFQVMPFHFQAGEDMLDPEVNADRGLGYFAQQLRETGGDVFRSFAGYNGGSAASSSGWDSWANETQRYYVWSKGIYEEAKSGLENSPTLQRWMEAGGASLCHQAAERLGLP